MLFRSYDIDKFLKNLSKSSYKYLLTTSYLPSVDYKNRDISTGDFRKIDLLAPPFSFPSDPKAKIADWVEPESPRYLLLWEKNQVPINLNKII